MIFFVIKMMQINDIKQNLKMSYYSYTQIDTTYIYSRIYKKLKENFPFVDNEKLNNVAKWGVAQSLLETGYYQKIILYIYKDKKIETKNLFNIKYGSLDKDFSNYYRIYDQYCASVEDYVNLLIRKSYREFLEKYFNNELTFEQAMRRISLIYAEDTHYFQKVYQIYLNLPNYNLIDIPVCLGKIKKIQEVI